MAGSRAQYPKQVAGLPDVRANELQRDRESSALMLCYFVSLEGGGVQILVMKQAATRAAHRAESPARDHPAAG